VTIAGISSEIWFPVVTLILGALLKGAFDTLADTRRANRERAAREHEQRRAAQLRRIEFQRETLLNLQDLISAQARTCGKMHVHDIHNRGAPGGWASVPLDPEISEQFRHHQSELARLCVRVRDNALREKAKEFSAACTQIVLARSALDGQRSFHGAVDVSIELNEQVGQQLRTLDDEEDVLNK
jgi:hypothetical protein